MKTPLLDRRIFLRAAGAGLALGGLGKWASAAGQQQGAGLTAVELRDGLFLVSGAGGNFAAFATPDGVALVDSGDLQQADSLLPFLAETFGDLPVPLLFNTNWRPDHTGGNAPVGQAGAKIIAHENTRLWMSTKVYVDWQDRLYTPRPAAALPTHTFYTSDPQPIEEDFGGERIVYAHLREAHTDGDIYVFFPERNVIVAGGTVTVGSYPILDYVTGGWIGGLLDATRKMIEMSDDDTLIVPKRGPAQSRAHLQAQEEMLSTVLERVEALAVQGKGADEMLAEGVTEEFDDRWGSNAELFLSNVYDGLWWGGRMRGIVA